jgi:anaerobic selenocysteine-containing dehydrogenase
VRPLVKWDDPESAFEAWKACSRGRPCDYTGLGYAKLRGAGGIQWPCTEDAPDGTERLYADGRFPTDPEMCEDYGHDLATGAEQSPEEYRARQPGGRAFLRAADYQPAPEVPDDDYPLLLTTGRSVYQFHTRTKTGRAPELQRAAPEAWVELSADDAAGLGVADGDPVRVESRRGAVVVPARVTAIAPGTVFVPFHYAPQAANELTLTAWDPVSKQPLYKTAAVRVAREG